jgi:hypothetical protein
MAYKQPSSGTPFKQMGSSPVKQVDHVGRTTDKILSNEKSIAELNKSRAKDIKKVKGNFVEISKKAIREQMKKAGTKVPYSKIKEALKTSIKAAGKTAKFVPGVLGLMLGATETAKADQPTEGKGKVKYPGGKIDFTSEK